MKKKGPHTGASGVMQLKLLHMERRETRMCWSAPTLVEICIGLEINGYLPAEF
jgi:coenzyme PQQ precursor peptide PqqA